MARRPGAWRQARLLPPVALDFSGKYCMRAPPWFRWVCPCLVLAGLVACDATQITEPGNDSDPGPGPTTTPPVGTANPFGDAQLWSHPNQLLPHLKSHPTGWSDVSGAVEVFGMFVGAVSDRNVQVGHYASDLLPLMATGRAVALEVGGLRPFACTGVQSAQADEKAIAQVEAAGFETVYIRLDNPFSFVLSGAFHDNPCQHSVQTAVDELIVYMQTVKDQNAGLEVRFGWDEAAYLHAWPGFPVTEAASGGSDLKYIMTAFLPRAAQAGVPIEFFHVDGAFNTHLAYERNEGGDPWARLAETAAHVRSLGARFGVLLNFQQPCVGGCATHQSGATAAEFVKRTLTYYDCLVENGIALDDVVPESWWNVPSQYFPVDRPDTFGYLTMGLAERMADPSRVLPCPTASFQGKWLFSDD